MTNYKTIDYANKKNKWTVMKYVASFDLILQYIDVIKKLGYQVDDKTIDLINKEMQESGVYKARKESSRDTQVFKIIQICCNMFAYRGKNQNIVFTPLCNLLLENRENKEHRGKIAATMLANLPFNNPYNKMDDSFNLFPYRLVFKLLLDRRLESKLYLDDVFYLVAWTKEASENGYECLVEEILNLRGLTYEDRFERFIRTLPIEDSLANMLYETKYLFNQLEGAGVVQYVSGKRIGTLHHGGFGRKPIPEFLEPDMDYKPTGSRAYTSGFITLRPYMTQYLRKLLRICDFTEKPHAIYEELGTDDYILKLWNFYPNELLEELGIGSGKRGRIAYVLDLTNSIKRLSHNKESGDCYRFEHILCDAFNEFSDVSAMVIAKPGTADIECIYLANNEKFDVEAKSTSKKLPSLNAGRLASHRNKIGSKYTIVVAPNYVPSVMYDIRGTDNVVLTVTSLCNYLYQSSIKSEEMTYKPLFEIIQSHRGTDISRLLDEYVACNFGISRRLTTTE